MSPQRSHVGDLYAATARRALTQGRNDDAAKAYNSALAAYDQSEIPVPADLVCAQALALASQTKTVVDDGTARALHACVLAVPTGSQMELDALTALAALVDFGLDPALLDLKKTTDTYFTEAPKAPKRPTIDEVDLEVKLVGVTPKKKRRSLQALMEGLQNGQAKEAFWRCWLSHWETTKEEVLEDSFTFKYRFYLDEDDEANDKASLSVAKKTEGKFKPLDTPSCLQTAVTQIGTSIAKGQREDTHWVATVQIRLTRQPVDER